MTAAVAAIALLALGGCGDDSGGDSTSPGETQSLQSFISQADAICTKTGQEVGAKAQTELTKKDLSGNSVALTEFARDVSIPALEKQFQQIGELPPPEGKEEEVQAILDAADEAIAQAKENPDSIIVQTGVSTPFDEVNQLEQELGLKVCGSD